MCNKIYKVLSTVGMLASIFGLFAGNQDAVAVQVTFGGIRVSGLTATSATISWISGVPADSQVAYGFTFAYGKLTTLDLTLTKNHSQTLTNLAPNSLYHFSVRSRTEAGVSQISSDLTFATPPNIVTGMISGVGATSITGSSASIRWTTNSLADSTVEYGPTINYGLSTQLATEYVTFHEVTLGWLTANTLYHYRVKSIDGGGNQDTSGDNVFTTASSGSPTFFTAITASAISATEATVSWTTGDTGTTQVDYGTSTSYGQSTATNGSASISHSQTLTGLTPGTLYHYRVRSTIGDANLFVSGDFTFTTPPISLYYPRMSLDPDSFTAVALTDLDRSDSNLDFIAFDASGIIAHDGGVTNPITTTLAAGAQLPVIEDQVFGSGFTATPTPGWTQINSSTGKVAGFFLTFNSTLSFMDGADIADHALSSLVLPESGSQDFTSLILVNPNSTGASAEIDLIATDGTVRASVQPTIDAHASYSADLTAATFNGVAANPADYVLVHSAQGLIGYEYFGNVSRDAAVLAAQDADIGATSLYSPQYVVGGPWNSTLSIVNLDSVSGLVTLKWVGDDGTQIGSTRTVTVSAGGKLYIPDPSFFLGSSAPPTQVTGGYVRITSSGIRLAGSVVFSDAAKGAFMTALPLVSALQKSQVLSHVASNDTYFTGISIMNPNSSDTTVTIDLYTSSGNLVESVTRVIPASHRTSQLVTQYFPDQVGQDWHSGYIRVTADKGVACFGVFGTQSLSVLAAIPAQAAQ